MAGKKAGAVDPNQTVESAEKSLLDEIVEGHFATVGEDEYVPTEDDLPILGWNNTVEAPGGNLTRIGFTKLVPGWSFRGYVLRETDIPATQFGRKKTVTDRSGNVVMGTDGEPMTIMVQDIYELKGTVRAPLQGSEDGTTGEVDGVTQIPQFDRLKLAIDALFAAEKKATLEARKADPRAATRKIGVEIVYKGQNPHSRDENGQKTRTGAKLFEVRQLRQVQQ